MRSIGLSHRLGVVALAVALGFAMVIAVPAEAKKPPKPGVGKACTREGETIHVRPGLTLICQRNAKGRLVWAKQATPGPGPSPAPAPIPATIESWGISVTPYDASTQRAGDLSLAPLPSDVIGALDGPITYYGGGVRRPNDPPDFISPQMTFIVPINTKVRAIVSGTVCDVRYLGLSYSEDYTIGIGVSVNGQPACQFDPGSGRGSGVVATWEHEHVMKPIVKQGDKVTAGQVIAEASWYTKDSQLYRNNLALYEIGVLTQTPSGSPVHLCPGLYLAPSAKGRLLSDLATAARAYEVNAGVSVYSPQALATGCVTDKPSNA